MTSLVFFLDYVFVFMSISCYCYYPVVCLEIEYCHISKLFLFLLLLGCVYVLCIHTYSCLQVYVPVCLRLQARGKHHVLCSIALHLFVLLPETESLTETEVSLAASKSQRSSCWVPYSIEVIHVHMAVLGFVFWVI